MLKKIKNLMLKLLYFSQIILFLICLIAFTVVMILYGDKPMSEVPFWIWILINGGRK